MEHNQIINKLERRLKEIGCLVYKCQEYETSIGQGECDLYGVDYKYKRVFIIEVKRKNNKHNFDKVKNQLYKDKNYIKEEGFDLNEYDLIKFYAFTDIKKKRGYNCIKIEDDI